MRNNTVQYVIKQHSKKFKTCESDFHEIEHDYLVKVTFENTFYAMVS